MDALQTIRENGICMLRLVGEILDLSQAEAGKLDIEWRVKSPHELASLEQSAASISAGRDAP